MGHGILTLSLVRHDEWALESLPWFEVGRVVPGIPTVVSGGEGGPWNSYLSFRWGRWALESLPWFQVGKVGPGVYSYKVRQAGRGSCRSASWDSPPCTDHTQFSNKKLTDEDYESLLNSQENGWN